MTFESAITALLQHFVTQWQATYSSIPIQYPNGQEVSANTETGSYIRFSALQTFGVRESVGGLYRRIGGRIVVNTFEPLENGDGLTATYCAFIKALWDSAHDDGLDGAIHLYAPETIQGAPDPEIPMWRSGVSIPFQIDHSP